MKTFIDSKHILRFTFLKKLLSTELYTLTSVSQIDNQTDIVIFDYTETTDKDIRSVIREFPELRVFVYGVFESKSATMIMRLGAEYCFSSQVDQNTLETYFISNKDNDNGLSGKLYKHRLFVGDSKVIKSFKSKFSNIVRSGRNVILFGEKGCGKSNLARIIHDVRVGKADLMKIINFNDYSDEYIQGQFWIALKNLYEEVDSEIEGVKETVFRTIFISGFQSLSSDFIKSFFAYIKRSEEKINNEKFGIAPSVIIDWPKSIEIPGEIKFYNVLEVPELKDRKQDLLSIIESLVLKYSQKHDIAVKGMSFDACGLLVNYDWPGNFIELQSVIENAVLSCNNYIEAHDLDMTINMLKKYVMNSTDSKLFHDKKVLSVLLDYFDRDFTKVSLFLGLNKTELFNKMNVLGISIS